MQLFLTNIKIVFEKRAIILSLFYI